MDFRGPYISGGRVDEVRVVRTSGPCGEVCRFSPGDLSYSYHCHECFLVVASGWVLNRQRRRLLAPSRHELGSRHSPAAPDCAAPRQRRGRLSLGSSLSSFDGTRDHFRGCGRGYRVLRARCRSLAGGSKRARSRLHAATERASWVDADVGGHIRRFSAQYFRVERENEREPLLRPLRRQRRARAVRAGGGACSTSRGVCATHT